MTQKTTAEERLKELEAREAELLEQLRSVVELAQETGNYKSRGQEPIALTNARETLLRLGRRSTTTRRSG